MKLRAPTRSELGIALVIASFAMWGVIFAVPMLDAPADVKVLAGGGIYGLSYLVMFAGIGLMGRQAYAALKARVWDRVRGRAALEGRARGRAGPPR
jgi:hypothetical protein